MANVKKAHGINPMSFMPQEGMPVDQPVLMVEEGEAAEDSQFDVVKNIELEPGEAVEVTDKENDIVFNIGVIPGAPDDVILDEFDGPEEPEEVMTMEPENNEPVDEWAWEKSHGVKDFLRWVQGMIENVPKHSGKDSTGIERAISYFDRVNKEISRAMSRDFKREIDAAKAQEARNMIVDGLKRLKKRLVMLGKDLDKSAGDKSEMIKKADTTTSGHMTVQVPYMISIVARACINSTVSNGKDMHDVFVKLAKEYNLDKREKLQVAQFIKDMGYPNILDRLRVTDGVLDMTDGEGEFSKQYYS